MTTADTVLNARWVIPVEPAGTLEYHSVAIRDGRIVAVLPTVQATAEFTARETIALDTHALIPGFVNAHTHAAMSLFRGLADDLPLMDWLQTHIWPAEAKHVTPAFIRDGARLAIAEMLLSGTTCFNDMYFFPEQTAEIAHEAGMRASLGMILLDFPTAYAATADEYIEKSLALHDTLRDNSLLRAVFAPHAPYTVSDAPLARVRVLANELDVPIHMHVHETAFEVADAQANTGKRPLARLDALDLLGPDLIAVHMTQLDESEIARAAQAGLHVAHCPESNLKLASGFCPVHALMRAGVNVCLGTDGAASNNDLDMFGEMRTAALIAKAVAGDAQALPAASALRMATLNGARALGRDREIGSITVGKAADLTAIDLGGIATQPVYDPVSQIVYSATRGDVTDVWVAGRRLLHARRLTSLDQAAILKSAAAWRDRISTRS